VTQKLLKETVLARKHSLRAVRGQNYASPRVRRGKTKLTCMVMSVSLAPQFIRYTVNCTSRDSASHLLTHLVVYIIARCSSLNRTTFCLFPVCPVFPHPTMSTVSTQCTAHHSTMASLLRQGDRSRTAMDVWTTSEIIHLDNGSSHVHKQVARTVAGLVTFSAVANFMTISFAFQSPTSRELPAVHSNTVLPAHRLSPGGASEVRSTRCISIGS